jgi:uncharacterized glyoxalase superfamily protein PhnB
VAYNAIPCLVYADARKAIDWLCDAFGFERKDVFDAEDGKIAHAELTYDGGLVMLGSTKDTDYGRLVSTPAELGGVNQSIYVVVDDIEAHYERAKAAGAEIVMELRDQDYGSRDYSARDLEGNLWNFGTYRPEDGS